MCDVYVPPAPLLWSVRRPSLRPVPPLPPFPRYVDLEAIPRGPAPSSSSIAPLQFQSFDFHTGTQALPVVKLIDTFEAQWEYLGSEGTLVTLQTNLDAPRYRVVRGDMAAAATAAGAGGGFPASCRDLLPQHDRDLLQWCCLLQGGTMVTAYLRDVVSRLQLRRWADGSLVKELSMPGLGSVAGFSGTHKHTEW